MSVDSDFDFEWKELVERKVSMHSSLSEVCEDEGLHREIENEEIVKCIQWLEIMRLVVAMISWENYLSMVVYLLEHSFRVVWQEKIMSREGLIVKKGYKEEPRH